HDGDVAGLFEVASAASARGRGFGRRVVLSALKWARLRGAKVAWLQVEADNAAAVGLYRSLGFREIYRYHYRQPPVPADAP
ncbi:MAG: GNAT family N-acetyltransferase, partial [Mesorhizobium sp.]|nr:GNAT family N-acetyltransferase [Mesorhizobium sp.]